MVRHLAVLAVMSGMMFLVILFFGIPGMYMMIIPVVFVIYLGISTFLLTVRRKSKSKP